MLEESRTSLAVMQRMFPGYFPNPLGTYGKVNPTNRNAKRKHAAFLAPETRERVRIANEYDWRLYVMARGALLAEKHWGTCFRFPGQRRFDVPLLLRAGAGAGGSPVPVGAGVSLSCAALLHRRIVACRGEPAPPPMEVRWAVRQCCRTRPLDHLANATQFTAQEPISASTSVCPDGPHLFPARTQCITPPRTTQLEQKTTQYEDPKRGTLRGTDLVRSLLLGGNATPGSLAAQTLRGAAKPRDASLISSLVKAWAGGGGEEEGGALLGGGAGTLAAGAASGGGKLDQGVNAPAVGVRAVSCVV